MSLPGTHAHPRRVGADMSVERHACGTRQTSIGARTTRHTALRSGTFNPPDDCCQLAVSRHQTVMPRLRAVVAWVVNNAELMEQSAKRLDTVVFAEVSPAARAPSPAGAAGRAGEGEGVVDVRVEPGSHQFCASYTRSSAPGEMVVAGGGAHAASSGTR